MAIAIVSMHGTVFVSKAIVPREGAWLYGETGHVYVEMGHGCKEKRG